MPAEKLDEATRAEDILLGSLGYDESASIIEVRGTEHGYAGRARYSDGEEFEFESTEELQALEVWALNVLVSKTKAATGSASTVMTLGRSARLNRHSRK